MRIEILCTGDEVLSGKTVNTNYSHMARRLQETGLDVVWGTTVGDDRQSLVQAFQLASGRADAVIVNGGLGPTVDDLSQEVAAEAAGVELELYEPWLENIRSFYERRGREMPPNNVKQAMLPKGAEFIDNPVGTACGFAIDIGAARFFFTPGVPREIRKMLDDEIIPRLLAMSGGQVAVRLKRFHSFGLGESRVDHMLQGVEDLADGGEVKLGFQTHYPQLETKIFARGASAQELQVRFAPVERAVRDTLGAYLLAEDTESLEGNTVAKLSAVSSTIAVAECGTNGAVAGRLIAADADGVAVTHGVSTPTTIRLAKALDISDKTDDSPLSEWVAEVAKRVAEHSKATYGLAVVVSSNSTQGEGWVHVGIAVGDQRLSRAACFVGGPERVRVGGVEMALDCLRRHLSGLSIDDVTDFEKQ